MTAAVVLALVAGGSWALHWRRGAEVAQAAGADASELTLASWGLTSPVAPRRDPWGLMQGLADLRASAMNRADLSAVPRFDAPGSPALDSDTTDLAEMTTTGTRYLGVTLRVRSVRTVSAGAVRAVVEAVVDTGAYRVVGAMDSTTIAASRGSPLLFTLVWSEDQWRIFNIQTP
jgi:hypothetical protein